MRVQFFLASMFTVAVLCAAAAAQAIQPAGNSALGRVAQAQTPGSSFNLNVPPTWNSVRPYALGDVVQENQNFYRCTHAVTTPNLNPQTAYFNWELWEVRLNTTLTIGTGQTFPSLTAAWAYALNARIAPAAYLHFYIVSGNSSFEEQRSSVFNLDHPYGAQISILGDHEASVYFHVEGANAFVIDTGHTIASISNMVLLNKYGGGKYIAILAQSNASLPSLSNLSFLGSFSTEVYAGPGSIVNLTGNNTFYSNGYILVEADGGTLNIPPNTELDSKGGTYCVYAINGATVSVGSGSTLTNAQDNEVFADFGSFVNVSGCSISGSSADDVEATHASNVLAVGSGVFSAGYDLSSNVFRG